MFEIMTVCTGNICRSPLAEQILRTGLAGLPGTIVSAGTQGLAAAPMPAEAQRLATAYGVPAEMSSAHRSRPLFEQHLMSPDLVLGLSREHRRRAVEFAPSKLRYAFTVREFARLAADTPDEAIISAADGAGDDVKARLRAAVTTVGSRRGMILPPEDPADDDVVDPYRRSWETYLLSGEQMVPALDQVIRVVKLAVPTQRAS